MTCPSCKGEGKCSFVKKWECTPKRRSSIIFFLVGVILLVAVAAAAIAFAPVVKSPEFVSLHIDSHDYCHGKEQIILLNHFLGGRELLGN